MKRRNKGRRRAPSERNALNPRKTPFDDFAKAHAVIIGVFSLFVKGSTRFSLPNFPKRAYFHSETSLRQSFFNIFSSPQNRTRRAPPRKIFQKILKKAIKNLQSLFAFVKITFISDGKSDYFRFSVVATRVFAVRRLFSSRFFRFLLHRDRRRPKRWPRRPSQPQPTFLFTS